MKKSTRVELNTIYMSERVRESLRVIPDYVLTTVIAPMGYGKTTSVNWFLADRIKKQDAVVIRVNIYSDNLMLFWKSIKNAFLHEGLTFLEDYAMPSDLVGTGLLMDEFCRSFRDDKVYYIFLDDFHLLKNEQITDSLVNLCNFFPENVHVIVASRDKFLKNADVVRLGSKLHIIEKDRLSLNLTELSVYTENCGLELNEVDIEKLYHKSEGWFSAIYFSLRSYSEDGRLPEGNKDIYELFMSVMIDPLPDEKKEFLAVLGLADEFSAEMAEFITGRKDTKELLVALTEHNAFVTLLSDGKTYRFHHMMKECSARMFDSLLEEKKNDYLNRYGEWYENRKEYLHALESYEKNENFDRILGVIEKDAGVLLALAGAERIIELITKCSEEILKKHPTALLVLMRRMFTWRKIPEMMRIKALLETTIKEDKEMTKEQRGNLLGEIDLVMSFLMYNDIKAMSALHRSAASQMTSPAVSMRNEGSWTFGSPSVLMMFYREYGELDVELAAMEECMPHYYKLTGGHGFGAEMVMDAEAAFYRCRYDDAAILLEQCRTAIAGKGSTNMELCCDFLESRLSVCCKNAEFRATEEKLSKLKKLHDTMWINIYDCTRAYYYSVISEPESVSDVFKNHDLSSINYLMPCKPMMEMIENQVYLAEGNYIKVIGRMPELFGVCQGMHYALVSLHVMIQAAAAYEMLEKYSEADDLIKKAIDFARADGIILPFAENYRYIANAVKRYAKENNDDFAAKIIEKGEEYRKMLPDYNVPGLSDLNDKELEIVRLISEHCSNKDIAEKLFLSEGTVKQYMNRIYAKLSLEGDSHDKRKHLINLIQQKK